MQDAVQDAASIHTRLTRSQPASGLRRQPELCQQVAAIDDQDGGAVGMVSECNAGGVDSVEQEVMGSNVALVLRILA